MVIKKVNIRLLKAVTGLPYCLVYIPLSALLGIVVFVAFAIAGIVVVPFYCYVDNIWPWERSFFS